MSLNNVQLNPQLIADLYADVLVETDATPVPNVAKPVFQALGGNAKNILVVVTKEAEAFLPEEELNLLTNILAACKLSLADVALVNFNRLPEESAHTVIQHFNSKHILLFDVAPLQFGLPFNFPAFQVQQFDGRTYLQSPDLQQVADNRDLKMSLWNALKNIFGL